MAKRGLHSIAAALEFARRLPDVEHGIACAGTKLESRTLKVRGKAFAFFRPGHVMLKLGTSLAEARSVASTDPRVRAGASGWVTVQHGDDLPIDARQMQLWLAESHGLFAGQATRSGSPRKATKRQKP